jgi:hypothetical protein
MLLEGISHLILLIYFQEEGKSVSSYHVEMLKLLDAVFYIIASIIFSSS